MNDQELIQLWQKQDLQPVSQKSDTEITAQMKAKLRKFDRDIFWRDIRELAACGVQLCIFGPALFGHGSLLSRAGGAVVVLSAIFIGLVLLITKQLRNRHRNSDSVREFVSAGWSNVNRQRQLLASVLWWYILPIYIGVEMYIFGLEAATSFKIVFTVVYSLVCAGAYWINQYVVRKRLSPLCDELDQLLHALPSPTELNNR
jgi:hypothetical protein